MRNVARLIVKTAKRIRKKWIIRRLLKADRLQGDRLPYYCPCCDTHFKRFVSNGYDRRPERYDTDRYRGRDQAVICPICGALPRHRILAFWMNDRVDDIRGKRILHFAQERALRMWLDRNGISCTTADLYKPADLKLDIADTRLEDASYDLIICNHVLEHVPDYGQALTELKRILRPGGRLLISFPVGESLESVYEDAAVCTKEQRIKCFGQYDHLRVFGRDSARLLRSFGFQVTEIRGDQCPESIKPVTGPADYDYNVLWCLTPEEGR